MKGKARKAEREGTEGRRAWLYPGARQPHALSRTGFEVHLYRRQSVSQQRQTNENNSSTGQTARLSRSAPESRFYPQSILWEWRWGPAGGRRRSPDGIFPGSRRGACRLLRDELPSRVDCHGAMLAWSSASGATVCDPIMASKGCMSWPGGRESWPCCGVGWECWLRRVGSKHDNAEGQAAAGSRPCLVEIWVKREMASWKDAANDCAAVFRLTGA